MYRASAENYGENTIEWLDAYTAENAEHMLLGGFISGLAGSGKACSIPWSAKFGTGFTNCSCSSRSRKTGKF
jgi:hypothetical protein